MNKLRQRIRVFSGLKRIIPRSIHALFIISVTLIITPSLAVADRFAPPSLSLPLQEFDSRLTGRLLNVDFIFAHVINNGRKVVREVGEITNQFELLNDTTVFTNSNLTGSDSASAGSVIIPPGTSADTIIVLNQNDGDSIAIQR